MRQVTEPRAVVEAGARPSRRPRRPMTGMRRARRAGVDCAQMQRMAWRGVGSDGDGPFGGSSEAMATTPPCGAERAPSEPA